MSTKQKQDRYLFLRVDEPRRNEFASGKFDNRWHGSVVLLVCTLDQSGGESRPKFLEYGDELANVSFAVEVGDTTARPQLLGYGSYRWKFGATGSATNEWPMKLDDLEQRVKVIRRVEASARKVAMQFGDPKSFGQFVAQRARSMGVVGVIRASRHGGYLVNADITNEIDFATSNLVRDCRVKAGKPADIPATEDEAYAENDQAASA